MALSKTVGTVVIDAHIVIDQMIIRRTVTGYEAETLSRAYVDQAKADAFQPVNSDEIRMEVPSVDPKSLIAECEAFAKTEPGGKLEGAADVASVEVKP